MNNLSDSTKLLTHGRTAKGMDFNNPQVFPFLPNTVFRFNTLTESLKTPFPYIRMASPNSEALADIVNCLEDGERTLICTSGMGAISTTLMALLSPGDEAICNSNIYGETFQVFSRVLPKFGVKTKFIDMNNDLDALSSAMNDNVKLVYTEVCANPTLYVANVPEIASIAHRYGALLMIDNTFTSPISIKPLHVGADIVINSLTKYMNGHSDAIGGSVTSTGSVIEKVEFYRTHFGTTGDAFDCFTMTKNFGTMDLRVRRQMSSAAKLAKALEVNPHVKKVNHPSLPSHPHHALSEKLFRSPEEISGMLSFEIDESIEKIDAFLSHLQIASYASSLGGIHTTVVHPVSTSHYDTPDEVRRKMGITPGLLRISTGIEDVDDLIADFYQALEFTSKV